MIGSAAGLSFADFIVNTGPVVVIILAVVLGIFFLMYRGHPHPHDSDHEQGGMDVLPLWWALSLGACLGGNGSLIGASANVVLAGVSAKNGYPITFMSYLKKGFPLMLLSVAICTVYLLIRFA